MHILSRAILFFTALAHGLLLAVGLVGGIRTSFFKARSPETIFLVLIGLLLVRAWVGRRRAWHLGWAFRLHGLASVLGLIWALTTKREPLFELGLPAFSHTVQGTLYILALFGLWLADLHAPGGPAEEPDSGLRKSIRYGLIGTVTLLVVAAAGVWFNRSSYLNAITVEAEPERANAVPIRSETKLLLIGMDGATWDAWQPLLDAGELPAIRSLIERGHSGELYSHRSVRFSKGAHIKGWWSPVVWASIATGLVSQKHGILDFEMPTGPDGWQGELVPAMRTHMRATPFWEIFSEHGIRCTIAGWWNSYPAVPFDGELVTLLPWRKQANAGAVFEHAASLASDPQAAQGWVHPPDLLARYLPDLAFPDYERFEHVVAERLIDVDRNEPMDHFPPDHRDQENIWKLTVAQDWLFKEVGREAIRRGESQLVSVYLEGTDVSQHHYWYFRDKPMEMLSGLGEEPERIRDLVDNYYRLVDEWVAELLAETDESWNVMIVSDHGHGFSDRTLLLSDHEEEGVYVAAGPDFRSGKWPAPPWTVQYGLELGSPRILDVAPTLHYLFGVPLSEAMDGRPLYLAMRPELLASHPVGYVPDFAEEAEWGTGGLSEEDRAAARQALSEIGYTGLED